MSEPVMDVTINPLSKAIGAEILGIDLSEKVDSEDLFHINLAMQKSLVLVFRNQKLELLKSNQMKVMGVTIK